MDDLKQIKQILEAALLVAGEPVAVTQLCRMFDPPLENEVIRKVLEDLRAEWSDKPIELVEVASGWRFQGTLAISSTSTGLLRKSRATTRGNGNTGDHRLSATRTRQYRSHPRCCRVHNVIKSLEDRQWVEVVSRETPGRRRSTRPPRPFSTISVCARCPNCRRWPSSTLPPAGDARCTHPNPEAQLRSSPVRHRPPTGPVQRERSDATDREAWARRATIVH